MTLNTCRGQDTPRVCLVLFSGRANQVCHFRSQGSLNGGRFGSSRFSEDSFQLGCHDG